MTRANFPKSVKEALAHRVQYRCSFPECSAVTIGPSDESPEKTSNSGMACHIVAASGGPGARRVDLLMPDDQRESIENGIWMCYTHGKLIDTDETTYTIPMLKHWRRLAELKAKLIQKNGREIDLFTATPDSIPLAQSEIIIDILGHENELIGQTISNSCIADVWGIDVAAAIRDVAVELARNAFYHGGATSFKISIDTHKVTISDNGNSFLHSSLIENPRGRGGAAALKYLKSHSKLILSSKCSSNINETLIAIIKKPEEISLITPCSVQFEARDLRRDNFSIPILSGCDTTYVVMPMFISFSDAFKIIKLLKGRAQNGENFTIVTHSVSKGVILELEKGLPRVQIITL